MTHAPKTSNANGFDNTAGVICISFPNPMVMILTSHTVSSNSFGVESSFAVMLYHVIVLQVCLHPLPAQLKKAEDSLLPACHQWRGRQRIWMVKEGRRSL